MTNYHSIESACRVLLMMMAINLFCVCFSVPPKQNASPGHDTEEGRPCVSDMLDEPGDFAAIAYGPNFERKLSKYRAERKELFGKKIDDD